ncbi:Dabb family protein [Candidatus Parcubacteria bacterium]|nr:Dabb family protein [Candidatus Parcubacteria bacterium]
MVWFGPRHQSRRSLMESNGQEDVLHHIVLISFKPGTPPEVCQGIYNMYQTLDQECGGVDAGIFYWKVGHSLDTRKNIHLVEVAIFRDDNALQAFRVHPKHQELTNQLREIADWWVGDMMAPLLLPV